MALVLLDLNYPDFQTQFLTLDTDELRACVKALREAHPEVESHARVTAFIPAADFSTLIFRLSSPWPEKTARQNQWSWPGGHTAASLAR